MDEKSRSIFIPNYETLYKSEKATGIEIQQFINSLPLPKLTMADRKLLDGEISDINEVLTE